MVVNILNWRVEVCLHCYGASVQQTHSHCRYFFIFVGFQNEVGAGFSFLCKFGFLFRFRKRNSLSWKLYISGRWRRHILLLGFVAQTHWKFSFWVFFPQLCGYVSFVELFHELFIFGFAVVIKLTVVDREAILVESNFNNICIFAFFFFDILLLTSECDTFYFEFFSAFCMIPCTSGLMTAIPLLSPPV